MNCIKPSEYEVRRQHLLQQLPAGSAALLFAAPESVRSRDTHFPYRQDSDFDYLTGFAEPEAVLLLLPGRSQGQVVMFCRARDAEREIWDGRRAGPEGLVERYGADAAYPIEELDTRMPQLLCGCSRLYYPMSRREALDPQLTRWLNALRAQARAGIKPPGELADVDALVHEMRIIKSDAELALMQRAGDIGAAAHVRAMQNCAPGLFEYQLEADILHEFGRQGARSPAYNSIVGGGANGCILHYVDNTSCLKDGDLVLVAAGCEYGGYCSDITRTFPVNGRFTEPQKALYQLVLDAQAAALEAVRPGASWIAPHDASVRVLTEGLVRLGLLEGEPDELIEAGAYKAFYMHRVGHLLGMDVHDVGDYKTGGEWRPLVPGMTLTVEPGLYIAPDCDTVDEQWRGIGIRIEDDVVVTESGCQVLSAAAPKSIADIEAVMAESALSAAS